MVLNVMSFVNIIVVIVIYNVLIVHVTFDSTRLIKQYIFLTPCPCVKFQFIQLSELGLMPSCINTNPLHFALGLNKCICTLRICVSALARGSYTVLDI